MFIVDSAVWDVVRGDGDGSAFERHERRAGGDEGDAQPVPRRGAFAEEEDRQQGDERQTGTVHGGDGGRVPRLQRAEVADPRRAGGEGGQQQEGPGARRNEPRVGPGAALPRERPEHHHHHRGADERGEVRMHSLHTRLGEEGRQRREEGGEQRPEEPLTGHVHEKTP